MGGAALSFPAAVAVLPGGDIIVADTMNNAAPLFVLTESEEEISKGQKELRAKRLGFLDVSTKGGAVSQPRCIVFDPTGNH